MIFDGCLPLHLCPLTPPPPIMQARAWHMPAAVAQKLALSAVLTGHEGCVNRLAWNEDGSLLASGSDDCNVRAASPLQMHRQQLPCLADTSQPASQPAPAQHQPAPHTHTREPYMQVILWPFPDTGRVPVCLRTRHRANLFGVAFLPHCNSTRVVTGA